MCAVCDVRININPYTLLEAPVNFTYTIHDDIICVYTGIPTLKKKRAHPAAST